MLNQSQGFAFKLISFCILLVAFAFVCGCASNPSPQPTTPPPVSKVAPPRDDCPNGAVPLADSRGTACWPHSEPGPPPAHCRPERCPATGYMFWNCPVPAPAQDAQGNLELEEAIEPTTNPAPAEDEHWLTSRLVGCAPEEYLAVGVNGRKRCEKIVRGVDGCPNGSMRTDSRGRTACLSEADEAWLDRHNWSVDSGMTDPCPVDPHMQCWWFVEDATTDK